MARKTRRRGRSRRRNPSGLTTGLLCAGAAVLGGAAGFAVASWGCANLIRNSIASGVLEPGPNYQDINTLASTMRGQGRI